MPQPQPSAPAKFDPSALEAIYQGHGPEAAQLAQSWAKMHALMLQGLAGVEERAQRLRSLDKAMAGFTNDPSFSIARTAEAAPYAEAIEADNRKLQEAGLQSMMRCAGVLDMLMMKGGADGETRMEATGKALAMCVGSLSERNQPVWRDYADQAAIALATLSPEPTPSGPSLRI